MVSVVGNWGGGNVWRITSGAFFSNAYFCEAQVEGGGILIDAGLDGLTIDAELSQRNFRPNAVFCTHGHFDHIGGASLFQKKYGCQVVVPKADNKLMKASNFMLMAMKMKHKVVLPDATLVELDHVTNIAGTSLRYMPAPGHTPGSCIIEFGSAWFTGDTLYAHGIGLSHLRGEDQALLKRTILRYWNELTPERTIYPGHGNASNGLMVRTGNAALLDFLGLAAS